MQPAPPVYADGCINFDPHPSWFRFPLSNPYLELPPLEGTNSNLIGALPRSVFRFCVSINPLGNRWHLGNNVAVDNCRRLLFRCDNRSLCKTINPRNTHQKRAFSHQLGVGLRWIEKCKSVCGTDRTSLTKAAALNLNAAHCFTAQGNSRRRRQDV